MKLSLGPVRVAVSVAALAVAVAFATGCAGSVPMPAAVGTTTVTSAAITPSALAPAAWDVDESSVQDRADSKAAPVAPPTWGTAVVAPVSPSSK